MMQRYIAALALCLALWTGGTLEAHPGNRNSSNSSNASYSSSAYNTNNPGNVIAQMNYCLSTLTNIIHNKSIIVLDHECDQLVNNLTMEQMIGLPEIKDFRIELLDAISRFNITEEERRLMRRLQSIKEQNRNWTAVSDALGAPLFLFGGNSKAMAIQLAFNALLTASRTYSEYQTVKGQENIEELTAMWNLRKEDLHTINDLRKTALGITFELYNKYNLKENDRLTESSSNLLMEYISEKNPGKRIRLLTDNSRYYQNFADYYYYLGMAYIDNNDYASAKASFAKYTQLYKQAPILRYNEKLGCIALTTLTYDQNLSAKAREDLIATALANLPHNSAACLHCAMACINGLGQHEKGFQILRAGLDDPYASDKALLYMAATRLAPQMKPHKEIYRQINEILYSQPSADLDNYLALIAQHPDNVWKNLQNALQFKDVSTRKISQLGLFTHLNPHLTIQLPKHLTYHKGDLSIFLEKHSEGSLQITELEAGFKDGIPLEEINEVDCFKANPGLKFLFMNTLEENRLYQLKENIDCQKIEKESWPRITEFVLSKDDIEDIINFCEDHIPDSRCTPLVCRPIPDAETTEDSTGHIAVEFTGNQLTYRPHHSHLQAQYYLRITCGNHLQFLFEYNSDEKCLEPFLYTLNQETHYYLPDNQTKYEASPLAPEEPSGSIKEWMDGTKEWMMDKKDRATEKIQQTWQKTKNWFGKDE